MRANFIKKLYVCLVILTVNLGVMKVSFAAENLVSEKKENTAVLSQNINDSNSIQKTPESQNISNITTSNNVNDNISEEEKEKAQQLQNYQGSGMTRWLIDNSDVFANVIEQTSQETKTKWYLDQELQKLDNIKQQKSEPVTEQNNLDDATPTYHIVVKGDTLYNISKKYNVVQNDILLWNNIPQGSTIKLGSILKIFTVEKPAVESPTALVANTNEAPAENINDENINDENTEAHKTDDSSEPEKEQAIISPTTNQDSAENKDNSEANANENTKDTTIQENGHALSNDEIDSNQYSTSGDIQTSNKLPEYKYYKTKRGDTYYSIASKNNMTTNELLTLNNLDANTPLTLDTILKVKSNYVNWSTTDKKIAQDGFLWPVVGRLLIPFGPQSGGTTNEGINILAKHGTDIRATQDGIVTYIGDGLKSFGNIILIQHTDNWVSAYAHVDSITVKKGQIVKKGDIIAKVSNSGNVSRSQLHFELRHNIKPMDPLAYLQGYR